MKIPPQALDFERSLLGYLLVCSDEYDIIRSIIDSSTFYDERNSLIFSAIEKLKNDKKPIDLLTVRKELGDSVELIYISDLANNSTSINPEYVASIIAQKALQREIIKCTSELQNSAYDNGDVADTVGMFAQFANDIIAKAYSESNTKEMCESLKYFREQTLIKIKNAANGIKSGVMSGFAELDLITGGWQNSDLIIIGARPSMGKTAVAIEFAKSAAKADKEALFFSIEMNNIQLIQRYISGETNINASYIRDGKLNDYELSLIDESIAITEKVPFVIDDTPSIKLEKLIATTKQRKIKGKLGLVVIDYLQLITTSSKFGSREQEVAHISRSLKALAKECDVPIIALSQLNRNVTSAGDKRPQLSDLRESGAIEQDADVVVFVHRQAYYDKENIDFENKLELLCKKHRNGAIGDTNYRHNKYMTKFTPWDDAPEVEQNIIAPPIPTPIENKHFLDDDPF